MGLSINVHQLLASIDMFRYGKGVYWSMALFFTKGFFSLLDGIWLAGWRKGVWF